MSQSKSPVVSVIIPTCNRAHLVGRAIRSVLAQTFQDWELIVVDDGSTDNSVEAIRCFHDERITYMSHSQNRGASAARNTGIRCARGEYIAFLDSDDEWLPPKLERQLQVFQQSKLEKLGIVLCGKVTIGRQGLWEVCPEARGWVSIDLLLARDIRFLGPPCWLVKRGVVSEVGFFDEAMPAVVDRDWFIRLSRSFQIDYATETLVVVHQEDGHERLRADPDKALKGLLRMIEKYSAELSQQPRLLAQYHQMIATLYFRQKNWQKSKRHLVASLKSNPRNLKLYVWLAALLLGSHSFRFLLKVSDEAGRFRRKKVYGSGKP